MAESMVRPVAADLDWAALRFPGEAELRAEVAKRADLLAVAQRWAGPGMCPLPLPVGLKHAGIRASMDVAPALARAAEMLRDALRLEHAPEIVVFPAAETFIDVLPGRTPIRIAVSSAAVARLSVREALFALGRRLARPRFGQMAMLADPTAANPGRDQQVLLLRGLWKFEELTCDRVGLLCCQDADAACRAILKLASGLGDDLLAPDFDGLLAERGPEEEAMVADDPAAFALLRLAALRQFAAGPRYAGCFAAAAAIAVGTTPAELWQETAGGSPSHETVAVGAASLPPTLTLPPKPEEGTDAIAAVASDFGGNANGEDRLPPTHTLPAKREEGTGDAAKDFALWGAWWTLGAGEPTSKATQAKLFDLFGSAAAAAADELRGPHAEDICSRKCADLAQQLADAPEERRRAALDELMQAATADGALRGERKRRAAEAAELLGFTRADLDALAAEHADPEFADYQYRLDQAVEVMFDDEWTSGVVRRLGAGGNVRVFFPGTGDTLWLSPTADLIRPARRAAQPAGA